MYGAIADSFPMLTSSKTWTPLIVVLLFAEVRPACIQCRSSLVEPVEGGISGSTCHETVLKEVDKPFHEE